MKIVRLWLEAILILSLFSGLWIVLLHGPAPAQPVGVTCGQILTADTILTHDLNNCPGDGLVLGASDIRLDCASHTLTGSGMGTGVRIPVGVGGIEVVNCRVSQFGTGLDIAGSGEAPNLIANNVLNGSIR